MTEAEFSTIKELYDLVADDDSASYDVFRKKLLKVRDGNIRTLNSLSRNLDVEPEVKHPKITSEFVAYDGEGWSDKYVLLANSRGERIVNQEGLSTRQCLEFLARKYESPTKRIFFAFSYDVNHIIKDFSDEQIETLLKGKSVTYENFHVSYIPGKIFEVNGYRYYDVFSFFATNFINVVRTMLGPKFVTEDLIAGKAGRGNFETWNLAKLIHYNDVELDLMVKIMVKLRTAFSDIGVKLTEWYGPGAVAKFWFKQHGILPQETHTAGSIKALNSAYYGGRFEQLTLGKVKNVYEYDIHSAYPSAMVSMPYFKSWRHVSRGRFIADPYSIWYISFDLRQSRHNLERTYNNSPHAPEFGPLPIRSKDGRICYPLVGKGWYWYEEVKLIHDFFKEAKVIYHGGYIAETEGQPFEWIKDLYDYRMQLKSTGSLTQYAIKVGLNSLYGKCAQRVGRNPYFSLAWAGYITATTRAKLARAGYEAGSEHILGFATDALFSDCKLNVRCTESLGDWEASNYQSGTFFQSGIYRLTKSDGTNDDRYRGSPLRRGIDDIVTQLEHYPGRYPRVKIARFISHLLAIRAPAAYGKYRTKFVQVVYEIQVDAPYKRHYHGFETYRTVKGVTTVRHDYSKLLRGPIPSSPKVFAGDNDAGLSDYYLYNQLRPNHFESQPPPMKDANTQRLLEDAGLVGIEEGYDEVAKVELLPVVEDEMT